MKYLNFLFPPILSFWKIFFMPPSHPKHNSSGILTIDKLETNSFLKKIKVSKIDIATMLFSKYFFNFTI